MQSRGNDESRFLGATPRLPSSNLQVTIDFYVRILGFELHGSWPKDAPAFCILQRGAARLAFDLIENAASADKQSLGFYIHVDDARAMHKVVSSQVAIEWGLEVYHYHCREFAFRDPDGYLIIITEETDDPPTCGEE